MIPAGGDIAVGQELTDIDKGFDDGIEGDIYGFNLVLSPTEAISEITDNYLHPIKSHRITRRGNDMSHTLLPTQGRDDMPSHLRPTRRGDDMRLPERPPVNLFSAFQGIPPSFVNRGSPKQRGKRMKMSGMKHYVISGPVISQLPPEDEETPPPPFGYVNKLLNREPRSFMEMGTDLLRRLLGLPEYETVRIKMGPQTMMIKNMPRSFDFGASTPVIRTIENELISGKIFNEADEVKPLGLKLVEMSYHCGLRKGAPLRGKNVLVSWTRTPVRVFGGAILKDIEPFCRR